MNYLGLDLASRQSQKREPPMAESNSVKELRPDEVAFSPSLSSCSTYRTRLHVITCDHATDKPSLDNSGVDRRRILAEREVRPRALVYATYARRT